MMETLQKYDPALDQLSGEEEFLLQKCLVSVEKFIKISKEISNTSYATRDAHSKTYALLQGTLTIEKEIPDIVQNIFSEANYPVILRLSHANPVISRSKVEMPLYGFALKIKNLKGEVANYPLVNFPIFPEKSPANFLRFFTALNTFLYTKEDNFVVSAMDIPQLLKHWSKLMPGLLNWSFIRNFQKLISRRRDFILSFDFHSIGVYRIGDFMMKLRAVPEKFMPRYAHGMSEDERVDSYLAAHNVRYVLQAQFCQNLDKQPVNDLSREWSEAPFVNLGMLEFDVEGLMDADNLANENLGFSPFENPENLWPVGKIQHLRKKVYETSIETRNRLNGMNDPYQIS